MTLAAIYDIHGNLAALEAVLEEIAEEGVDEIVVGGDVVPGPMPAEALDRLRVVGIPTRFILGNGEIGNTSGQQHTDRSSVTMSAEAISSETAPKSPTT